MTADLATADRRAAVRDAAAAWRAAGRIEEATLERVAALYPDDRVRAGVPMRILLGLFTALAGFGVFGVLAVGAKDASVAIVVGVGAAVVTELLVVAARRRRAGIEEGTAFLTLVMFMVGIPAAFLRGSGTDRGIAQAALATGLIVAVLIVWRWGMPTYAALGAAALYLLLAQTPIGLPLWVIVPLLAWPLLARGSRASGLAPAHREACSFALVVSLAALYLAANLATADHHWIAHLDIGYSRWATQPVLEPWLRTIHAIATAILPLLVIAIGVRRREKVLLWCGTLMAVASLVTLRYYVHLAPLWLELAAAGAALIAFALLLRRWLDAGTGMERAGLTAEPLFSGGDKGKLLEAVALLATFTPQVQPLETKPALEAGGGQFGGGGASDSF